jgi:hypothetical protein
MKNMFLEAKEKLDNARRDYNQTVKDILGRFSEEEISNAREEVDIPSSTKPYVVYCKSFNFAYITLEYDPRTDSLELFVNNANRLNDEELFEVVTEYNKISDNDSNYKMLYDILRML